MEKSERFESNMQGHQPVSSACDETSSHHCLLADSQHIKFGGGSSKKHSDICKCPRFSVKTLSWVAACLLLLISLTEASVGGCNEAVCASIVSKCTLLKSCDCEIEPTGCSCCKKCFACLEYLQADCCSCVGLCPTQNVTSTVSQHKSIVSDFPEAVPQLWDALTKGNDEQGRWNTITYPVDIPIKLKKRPLPSPDDIVTIQETAPSLIDVTNCTVAYLRQCMAETKCEMSCKSMGASSYRWFTDACCECIGHNCINYGINESRCAECSYEDDDDVPEEISDEEWENIEQEYAEELEALEVDETY